MKKYVSRAIKSENQKKWVWQKLLFAGRCFRCKSYMAAGDRSLRDRLNPRYMCEFCGEVEIKSTPRPPSKAKSPKKVAAAERKSKTKREHEDATLARWLRTNSEGESATGWIGYFDGACEPTNPGNTCVGAVLYYQGEIVQTVSKSFGWGTNNTAEYQGLIELLDMARARSAQELIVCGDSQLVIRQMEGQWRVKDSRLKQLHAQAQALVEKIPGGVRFAWVRREYNTVADGLSKGVEPTGPKEFTGSSWRKSESDSRWHKLSRLVE